MENSRTARAALAVVSAVLVSLLPGVPAGPAYARAAREPLHALGHVSYDFADALTVTTKGVAVAVWPAGTFAADQPNRVKASIRRPGHGWTTAVQLGHSPAGAPIHAAALAGGGAVVTWLGQQGTAVLAQWHPHGGWRPLVTLSEPGAGLRPPTVASNLVAHTWAVGMLMPDPGQIGFEFDVVRHHDGHTTTTVLGTSGCPSSSPLLAVDDTGDVAATWTGGTTCDFADLQPEAGLLPAGTTSWTTQAIGDCASNFCTELTPFRTHGGLALTARSYTQTAGHLDADTRFWDAHPGGQWTQEPGDFPYILFGAVSNKHGDLLACARERHRRLYVRPVGGDWERVDLPDFRADSCAINNAGRVVAVGNRMSGNRPLALMWGHVGQSAFSHTRLLGTGHGRNGAFPRVALTDSDVVTALAAKHFNSDAFSTMYGGHVALSASASRGPAG
jgi:hypothetical protein